MYYFNYRDELYHYGVLGMKWGVRRYQDYGEGGYTPKRKMKKPRIINSIERNSGKKGTSVLKEARSKDINELTTKELKEYNDRLQAEQNFQRLTEGGLSRGRKVAIGLLSAVTVDVAKELSKKWVKDNYKTTIGKLIEIMKVVSADSLDNVFRGNV